MGPVQLLGLEQGDRQLEIHTQDFLHLECLKHYPDHSLCIFYLTSVCKRSKARLPADGPREDFSAFAEWVLVNNDSPSTIGLKDHTSPHRVPVELIILRNKRTFLRQILFTFLTSPECPVPPVAPVFPVSPTLPVSPE
ncbi:hypothetical protein DPX16_10767 [Anabarilius grahami]|uniref:Uncharacterized protein n=1 Tax=Anabarilius grahami TaxID=495550 RepID=A0A3N0Z7W7_ANAGA|nr:hypothetical protein DPX16_10767 [Anabarilius grahami]